MQMLRLGLLLGFSAGLVASASATQSIARVWDEQGLSAIRIDTPNPPVQARNLFSLSAAMYDAWAVYDPVAVGYLFHEKHTASDVAVARQAAISYAAYRMLKERCIYSKSAANTLAALDAQMVALGYDTNNLSLDTATPAGVGNSVYATVSAYFSNDGARQTNGTPAAPYPDYPTNQGGYVSINLALITGQPGDTTVSNPNRWQPLAITNAADQNGFPASLIQKFLGAQWLGVRPFSLARTDSTQPWFNPGVQPQLNGTNDAQFRNEVVDVIRKSGQLTPDDGVTLDISPGAFGNNTLGANDGTGHPINPATGLPYPANVVKRGDFARVLAEYWADGPNSETPPGHWNVIANRVADNTNTVKRIGGTGPVVDDLEWDVKVYFAVNAALHDAACAAWSLKRYYDGGRPIEWIRYMGQYGESTDTNSYSYSINGLPLTANVVELTTASSTAPGGRHQGLPAGMVVINAWAGQPTNPATQYSGVHWMVPSKWYPYQKATFVTPAFPGYISGHSTFSRSAAEVLAGITGSPFFPGGLDGFTAAANAFLTFEQGPSQTVQLQWGTYYDASDQAGISRLYGGIHISVDDLTGRVIGSQVGQNVWALAQRYFDGSVATAPVNLAIRPVSSGVCEVRFDTVRGLYYGLQFTTDFRQPFINDLSGLVQAVDTSMAYLDTGPGPKKFFRVVTALAP